MGKLYDEYGALALFWMYGDVSAVKVYDFLRILLILSAKRMDLSKSQGYKRLFFIQKSRQ